MNVSRWYWYLLRPAVVALIAFAASPAPVSACDYGYRGLPELFDASTDVFVGMVTESVYSRGADGRIIAKLGASPPVDFHFKVLARYKGAAASEVVLKNGLSDCAYGFLEGATYMVHAFITEEGHLVSGQAQRPILISLGGGLPARRDDRETATLWSPELAIAYADARSQGRPHAFIQGSVSFNGRYGISGAAGPFDEVTVDVERVGGTTAVVRASNTPWSVFEMVLPPGQYRFQVRLFGAKVGDLVTVSVVDGELRRVDLGPGRPR